MNHPSPPSFWDQNYGASVDFKYGERPNAFLVAQAARFAPGSRILLPGDGEGRNGVWLAERGHRVLSVDGSAVGLADWAPEPASFDAVVSIYLHLPPALRRVVHRKLVQALRPGGWLVLEAFHPDQLPLASGGPKDVAMLYTLEMLRGDFEGLHELLAEETDTVLDEGPGHQGPAKVTRWVGRR